VASLKEEVEDLRALLPRCSSQLDEDKKELEG